MTTGRSQGTTRRSWTTLRYFKVEPWRIVTHFRLYHGRGMPVFEFEFRFGFPRQLREPGTTS